MVRVGIPRSLGYFYLFPLYRAFFDELGIPYVESPFTSEADLQNLDLCPTDEPCIAVNAAFTHVDRLLKMGGTPFSCRQSSRWGTAPTAARNDGTAGHAQRCI